MVGGKLVCIGAKVCKMFTARRKLVSDVEITLLIVIIPFDSMTGTVA